MSALLDTVRTAIKAKLDEREAQRTALEDLTKAVEARGDKNLTDDETVKFAEIRELLGKVDDELAELKAREADLAGIAERDAAAAELAKAIGAHAPTVRVKSEAKTYEKGNTRASYFADLAARTMGRATSEQAARLERHAAEMRVEYRDMTTTDGSLGEFVPPLWLVDMYADLPREGRITADLIPTMPLPAGTDSINIPRITTGTLTAVQASQNSALTEQDIVSTSVAVPVVTIGGVADVAVQALEQSALAAGMDSLIFNDLRADYDRRLNFQVLTGTGTSGQIRGFENTTGVGSTSITATSAAGLYSAILRAATDIEGQRFAAAQVVVAHPRRVNWLLAQADTTGRPLVVPEPTAHFNAIGTASQGAATNPGFVGTIAGLPLYKDPGITTTAGAGTNEDRVYVFRPVDHVLMESTPRLEVFRDVLSGSATVRFRLYNYAAFTAGRFPRSTNFLNGTGLNTVL